jgi:hypothetical protein
MLLLIAAVGCSDAKQSAHAAAVPAATSSAGSPSPPLQDAAADATPNAFKSGAVPVTAPPWTLPLVAGTWQAISKNRMKDVDPETDPAANPNYPGESDWHGNSRQGGVIAAWGGGALALGYGKYGALLLWGGGHQDYYGNEVYAFDLESLQWSRLSNPYPHPVFTGVDSYPDGRYPDGTPLPPHTVDRLEYHAKTNSLVALEAETNNLGGYTTSTAYMFSLDQRRWRHSQKSQRSMGAFGYSAYDTKRDLFWTEGGYTGAENPLSSFDPSPALPDGTYGAFAQYVSQVNTNGCVAAYDPMHDIVVVTIFRGGTEIKAIDVGNPAVGALTLKQSGAPPKLVAGHGWEWSRTREAFIYWAGDDVYEFKTSGASWTTAAWTWTKLMNPANRVQPDYAANGVYGRFRIAQYESLEVALTVNSNTGDVYALRLP